MNEFNNSKSRASFIKTNEELFKDLSGKLEKELSELASKDETNSENESEIKTTIYFKNDEAKSALINSVIKLNQIKDRLFLEYISSDEKNLDFQDVSHSFQKNIVENIWRAVAKEAEEVGFKYHLEHYNFQDYFDFLIVKKHCIKKKIISFKIMRDGHYKENKFPDDFFHEKYYPDHNGIGNHKGYVINHDFKELIKEAKSYLMKDQKQIKLAYAGHLCEFVNDLRNATEHTTKKDFLFPDVDQFGNFYVSSSITLLIYYAFFEILDITKEYLLS